MAINYNGKKSKHQVIKKTLYDYGEKKMNYFYIFEIQYEHSTLVTLKFRP